MIAPKESSSPLRAPQQTPDKELFDPTKSWVVSAGAGTGKTYRLVRRYLRCLDAAYALAPAGAANRVLAVTFTRAAAAEMRAGVLEALTATSAASDDAVLAEVIAWPEGKRRALIAQVADAPITTIHGFCTQILSEAPERTGVAPGFRALDPQEEEQLRDDFLRGFIDRRLQGGHGVATEASDGRVAAECTLSAMLAHYPIDTLRGMVEAMVRCDDAPDGLGEITTLLEARAPFSSFAIGTGVTDGEGLDQAPAQTAESMHCARIAPILALGAEVRDAFARHLEDRGLLRFTDLETRALGLFEQCKAAPADDPIRRSLRGRFAHVLVDEFQDTSALQVKLLEELIALVATESTPSTFYVGDPKQSIYRFRGADVSVFEMVIADTNANTSPNGARSGQLSRTRRTSPALARVFNRFFPLLFDSKQLSGDGDDGAPVRWDADIDPTRDESALPGPPVTLLLEVSTTRQKSDARGEEELLEDADGDGDTSETARVAQWVAELLENPESNVTAKDVVVLIEKWTDAEAYRRALDSRGVPATIDGGRGLKSLPETRDLANLVAFLANPEDGAATVGVLRGAIGGVSDLGLYVLARGAGVSFRDDPWAVRPGAARTFHWLALQGRIDAKLAVDALVEARQTTAERAPLLLEQLRADGEALAAMQPALRSLAARAGSSSTAALLEEAIAAFRLHDVWASEADPARAAANAWRFVERVRALEADGPNLAGALEWIDEGDDPRPEGLVETAANVITITSIHQAKGREWPVVVLAGLGRRARTDRGALRLNRVTGAASLAAEGARRYATIVPTARVPASGLALDDDPIAEAVKQAVGKLERAEAKRLLYVAMTRARDRLVLSGDLGLGTGLAKSLVDRVSNVDVVKDYGWRKLSACQTLGQMTVTALRLRPDHERRAWVLSEASKTLLGSDNVNAIAETHVKDLETRAAAHATRASDDPVAAPLGPAGRPSAPVSRTPLSPSAVKTKETPPYTVAASAAPSSGIAIPPAPAGFAQEGARWESLLGEVFHAAAEWWGGRDDRFPSRDDLARLVHAKVDVSSDFDVTWLEVALTTLARSALGQEMSAAAAGGALFHELPIEVPLPPVSQGNAHRLVGGRIDALFRDAKGAWVVVDYKLTKGDAAAAMQAYAGQLALYRESLEAAGITPVARLGLWLARSGEAAWTT